MAASGYWLPPDAPPLLPNQRYWCKFCWNLSAPSAKTGSWQESMKGMAPKNCKMPACQGEFPFKCYNRACPNKRPIRSTDDLVLLQMVNPKKADLHMIGVKSGGQRITNKDFRWVRVRPCKLHTGNTPVMCKHVVEAKGRGCSHGDDCLFPHSDEELKYWGIEAGAPLPLETADYSRGGLLLISGAPGKVPAKDAQATVKDDETGEVLQFRTVNGMNGAVGYVLGDTSVPEETFACGQDAIYSRRVVFERQRNTGRPALVNFATVQPLTVDQEQNGHRRGLLVIKGEPGKVPSAADVDAGTMHDSSMHDSAIEAWIIDDESGETLPFRNDPCRNTVVGYVLGRIDRKNRDAFECDSNGELRRAVDFDRVMVDRTWTVKFAKVVSMKPPHFRHLVICEIPGNCPRGDKCFDAHTYAQADRAIKNLHKAFPLKGAAVARFRTELDDAGCKRLLQFTRLCRSVIQGRQCPFQDSARSCWFAHTEEGAREAIARCAAPGTCYAGQFDEEEALLYLESDLQRAAPFIEEPDELPADGGDDDGGDARSTTSDDNGDAINGGDRTPTDRNGWDDLYRPTWGTVTAEMLASSATVWGGAIEDAVWGAAIEDGNASLLEEDNDLALGFATGSHSLWSGSAGSAALLGLFSGGGFGDDPLSPARSGSPADVDQSPLPGGQTKTKICGTVIKGGECRLLGCTYAHTLREVSKACIACDMSDNEFELVTAQAQEDIHRGKEAKTSKTDVVSGTSPAGGVVAYKPIFPGCLIERKFVNNRIQSVVEDKLDVVWYGRWSRKAPGRDTEYVECVVKELARTDVRSNAGAEVASRSKELEILKTFSSPDQYEAHICKLFDHCQDKDANNPDRSIWYAAMEVCQMTLKDAVAEGTLSYDAFGDGGPSLRQRVAWCHEMAKGLDVVHEKNVMHRDLKPSNVLLKRDGTGRYIVKISDFGSSRTQSVNHSTTTAGRGTVGWQAREVLQSDKQKELKRKEASSTAALTKSRSWYFKADVFSLGCVFFHCLARQHGKTSERLCTHPFGSDANRISVDIESAMDPDGDDLFRSWDLEPAMTSRMRIDATYRKTVAKTNSDTALLLDAWRLIRKMTNHKGSLRPSVDDVLHILENEGLLDPEQRCKMLKSVSRKFMNRKRGYRLIFVGPRLLRWKPEGSGTFPWRNDADWLQYVHKQDRALLLDWISAVSAATTKNSFSKNESGGFSQPADILRLINKIGKEFDQDTLTYQPKSVLFAGEGEVVNGNDLKHEVYMQAMGDWFCCAFPELIDLLWDGLGDSPDLSQSS